MTIISDIFNDSSYKLSLEVGIEMNFRRFFSVIIISAFLAVSTSCSFLGEAVEKPVPLTIYRMDYDSYTKNAIAKYNELHKDAKIQEKTYFIDQADEMAKDLNSGLASGGGPDIIVTLPTYLPELTKYIENGIFCDLNEMIEKDGEFKLSEYNEKVMESGVYNSKRYFIPLTYSVNLLFSTNDILDKNNINLDKKGVSLKQLSETALKYMIAKSNKDGYFFDSFDFNALVRNSNEKFVDVENKKASLDSPGFIELLKQYKQLYPSILPQDKRPTANMSEQLKNGSAIMLSSNIDSPAFLWLPYSSFTSEVDPFIMGTPGAEEGRGAAPDPGVIAAVNANCKYKKGAFEFIKILLSVELQEGDSMNNIPVNSGL
jgi:ABC-type glycerol-3-phosphate transport system substrate-binding protein